MTATVHKLRAGPLPHADNRAACRLSHEVLAESMTVGAHRMQCLSANQDPGDEMQGFGGSGPVLLIGMCVLMPMALWGVVALVRWSLA